MFKLLAIAAFVLILIAVCVKRNEYMRRAVRSKSFPYVVIAVGSFLVFGSIYGFRVLNPTYTDWLMAGGDLTQHYLGWKAFRVSAWHFPIGMTDTLAYPYQTSVIFTDSIPIFAVFFKILSPLLSESFQYFGLWGGCALFFNRFLRQGFSEISRPVK